MQNVDRNAIESVKNAVSNGEISISTANEIARLDEDEQEKIMESSPDAISHKNIKKINDDKKVATYGNFSEDDMSELDSESDEDDFAESYSKSDDATEKVTTYSNFLEDDMTEFKNGTVELDEETNEITLADFIHEYYFDLESIFTTYISLTDNPEETELLEKFQKLLYQTKEAERNKALFRP